MGQFGPWIGFNVGPAKPTRKRQATFFVIFKKKGGRKKNIQAAGRRV